MPDFEFDPNKTFGENVATFKEHVSVLDPQCAQILIDNLEVLVGDGDPARARARRGDFNAAVMQELEALASKGGGEL